MPSLSESIGHNQERVDLAEIGSEQAVVGWVAEALRERLTRKLSELREPGILVLDFAHIHYMGSSSPVIFRMIELSRDNNWQKAVACVNTIEIHRYQLQQAARMYPYKVGTDEPDRHRERFLLLACDRNNRDWHLLGEDLLGEAEKRIWREIKNVKMISVDRLTRSLGIVRKLVNGHLKVFIDNRILLVDKKGGRTENCSPINSHIKTSLSL